MSTQHTRLIDHPDRHIPFEGTPNFRDLGGYQGAEGGRVKWRQLFRSGHLGRLTDVDRTKMRDLGLDLVVDFRIDRERDVFPNLLPDPGPRQLILDMMPGAHGGFAERLMAGTISEDFMHDFMIEVNRALAADHHNDFQRFFRELIASRGPVLFHCAAGKDRTGFAAATILKTLGVSDEQIFEDYLLTTRYYIVEEQIQRDYDTYDGNAVPEFDRNHLRPMFSVHQDFLHMAFRVIEELGGWERYRREALQLSDSDVEHLRDRFLE